MPVVGVTVPGGHAGNGVIDAGYPGGGGCLASPERSASLMVRDCTTVEQIRA